MLCVTNMRQILDKKLAVAMLLGSDQKQEAPPPPKLSRRGSDKASQQESQQFVIRVCDMGWALSDWSLFVTGERFISPGYGD